MFGSCSMTVCGTATTSGTARILFIANGQKGDESERENGREEAQETHDQARSTHNPWDCQKRDENMKLKKVLDTIPFAEANEDFLFHVLCTFSREQIGDLARTHSIPESPNNKFATVQNIVDNKDRISAVVDILQ